jgi:hypothetical protein
MFLFISPPIGRKKKEEQERAEKEGKKGSNRATSEPDIHHPQSNILKRSDGVQSEQESVLTCQVTLLFTCPH